MQDFAIHTFSFDSPSIYILIAELDKLKGDLRENIYKGNKYFSQTIRSNNSLQL